MPESPDLPAPLLTADAVARLLSVDKRTVYRWAAGGILPCLKLADSVVRFDRSSVLEWLEDRSQSPSIEKE